MTFKWAAKLLKFRNCDNATQYEKISQLRKNNSFNIFWTSRNMNFKLVNCQTVCI